MYRASDLDWKSGSFEVRLSACVDIGFGNVRVWSFLLSLTFSPERTLLSMKLRNAVLLTLALTGVAGTSSCAPDVPVSAAPHWVKMPLLAPDAKAAGVFPGGEGGQWPRGPMAVSPADPNLLLLPIDVGGVYRSLDGGAHWATAMSGWEARGANGFAIDPKNASHVLGIAGNSMDWDKNWGPSPNGIYLSTDKAASWKHTLAMTVGTGGQVVFDPSSFDAGRKMCTVAYYLTPTQGLLRSDDGGETWSRPGSGADPDGFAGGVDKHHLAVDSKGVVYAGSHGLFRSADGGKTFKKIRAEDLWSVSVGPDNTVYVSGMDKVSVSHDGGVTWTHPAANGLDTQGGKPVCDLAVSPADPRRMLAWVQGDNWNWKRFYSADAGETWQVSTLDNTHAPLPPNGRQGYFLWSPADANVAYSLGGDWVTKSTDAGKTFHWSSNGENGIMLGGLFNFNSNAPGVVFLGFQDYNGAYTTDGGATWNYRDVSGKGWGGYEYGGYALSKTVMWAGDADGWTSPRKMRLTADGGKTWTFPNGADGQPLVWHGADVSCSDPAAPLVGFASNLRTADGGKTWAPMAGCDGVFIAAPGTHTLYGDKGSMVVRSSDHGVTWQAVADVPGGFTDLAVNPKTNTVYVAAQDHLKVWNGKSWDTLDSPHDQRGSPRVTTVALDPVNPKIIYVGGPRNIYSNGAAVCRSLDGGVTWENLSPNSPGTDGPHEVGAIRVDPATRAAWVNGQCYGMWRIAPPSPAAHGVSVALASTPSAITAPYPPAPNAPVPGAAPATTLAALPLQNGGMEAGGATPDNWAISWTGSGKLALARDTAEHHGGGASLRLASDGGAAKGQAGQFCDAGPGMTFTISGWVKTHGTASANFAVQPLNSSWTPVAFLQVGYAQNDTDWTHFEKQVTLPAGTSHAAVVLLLDGVGTAWLDDVTVSAK